MHGGRTAFVSPDGWVDGNDAFSPEYEFRSVRPASEKTISSVAGSLECREPESDPGPACGIAYFFFEDFLFPPPPVFLPAENFPPVFPLGLSAAFGFGAFALAAGLIGAFVFFLISDFRFSAAGFAASLDGERITPCVKIPRTPASSG